MRCPLVTAIECVAVFRRARPPTGPPVWPSPAWHDVEHSTHSRRSVKNQAGTREFGAQFQGLAVAASPSPADSLPNITLLPTRHHPPPSTQPSALILLSLALCATAQFQSLSSGFSFGDEEDVPAATKPAAKKPAAKAPAAADDAPAEPPTPKKAAAKKAPAPAPAAADDVAAPAPAAAKKAASSGTKADLQYTLTAKKATYDPATKQLVLESVSPQVVAVKDNGDAGKESKLGGAGAFVGGPSYIKRGEWLGGASGLLLGKSGAVTRGVAFDLSKPKWDAASSKATFDATVADGSAAVAGGVADGVAKSGKGAKPTNKVSLNDVVLVVDAVY